MNIYVLCTVSTGLETLSIIMREISVKGVIGLSRREPTDTISGYFYFGDFCRENGLDFVPVETYGLSSEKDRKHLQELEIDVLLVLGWQRLIPDWLIAHCKICAVGSHGSAYGIEGGRGRSPQNWALLMGEKQFYISIFKIEPGIDSGKVFDTRTFPLTDHDDIRTSYLKASHLTASMIIANLKNGKIQACAASPQEGSPKYLPQRLPEDGEIDWNRSTKEIYDFIRALTRPYPGAFSIFDRGKLILWKAIPFNVDLTAVGGAPGECIRRHEQGDLLIRTGDGMLLVTDYSIEPTTVAPALSQGVVLQSCSFVQQMIRIIDRHRSKYPGLPLADPILRLAGDQGGVNNL